MPTTTDKIARGKARGQANGVTKPAGARRRRYERTTPVGRVKKNLTKADRTLELVAVRLESWGARGPRESIGDSEVLDRALGKVQAARASVAEATAAVSVLEKEGFVPPRRSNVLVFEVGDQVQIGDKYREKYLAVYPPMALKSLIVTKVLPSGEIAVKHEEHAFIVPKSHLVRRGARRGV